MLRRADVERYLGKVVKIFFIQNDNEDFNIGVLKDVSDTSVLIASRTGRLTTISLDSISRIREKFWSENNG